MKIHTWTTLGLELTYRSWGPDDAPVLIALHGFLDTGTAFRPVAERLAARYRVVAPDQRGHGDSGHVGAGGYYHFPDYVLDLDGLYRHLGVDQAVLVGHSMGGSIAGYFAGTFPERVRALALLDGIGPTSSLPLERHPDRMARWVHDVRHREGHAARGAESLDAMARRIGRLSSRASEERLLELAEAASLQGEDGRWRWRFDPLHRTLSPIPFDPARFRAFLAKVDCPVLALWGEVTPMHADDEAERIAALGDVTSRTLPDTGHNMHHERPEAVADAVLAFLEERLP
ncbi:MAG: alpha/beta fold hydrolase [Myxococcota bacterium]